MTALALAATRAEASGFAVPTLGPTNSGVSTADPMAVHVNPGALGFMGSRRVLGGGHLLLGDLRYQRTRRATYQREDSLDFALPIDPLSVDPDKTGKDRTVRDRPLGALPAAFAVMPIPQVRGLVAGLGVDVPYAAQVAMPSDGPQRFQLTRATLATVFLSGSLGYRVHRRWSVGVGATYVLGLANISKIQDLATLPDIGAALGRPPINQANSFGLTANPGVRELDTMARPFEFKNGIAHGITGRVGVTGEPVDDLWVAASYEHTTQLNFKGDFTLDMNDPFFTQDLASQGLKYPAQVRGSASLGFVLPRVVRVGARYDFGRQLRDKRSSSVAIEGTYTGWSSIDDFDVKVRSADLEQKRLGLPPSTGFKLRRDWNDTFGGTLKGRHALSDALELWASLGCETAATPDSTIDVASPDGTRVSVGAGLSQHLFGGLSLLLDGHLQTVLERKVTDSDYDLGNGTYALRLLSLGALADYRFP